MELKSETYDGENSKVDSWNHGIKFDSQRDQEGIQIVLENGDMINMSYDEAAYLGAYLSGSSGEFYRQKYSLAYD